MHSLLSRHQYQSAGDHARLARVFAGELTYFDFECLFSAIGLKRQKNSGVGNVFKQNVIVVAINTSVINSV